MNAGFVISQLQVADAKEIRADALKIFIILDKVLIIKLIRYLISDQHKN